MKMPHEQLPKKTASTRARSATPPKTVSAGEFIDSESVKVPQNAELVPPSVVSAHLKRLELDLRRRHTHPEDACECGVPAVQVRNLTMEMRRKHARQKNLVEPDLASAAAAETAATRAAEERFAPVIKLARAGKLSAEGLTSAIYAENDPRTAVDRYLSFSSSATTIVDDAHERRAVEGAAPTRYDARDQYELKIGIEDLRLLTKKVKVILLKYPQECELFEPADVRKRRIWVDNLNDDDLLFIGLIAAYKLPVNVELKLVVTIRSGKLDFTGKLTRPVRCTENVAVLSRAMHSQTKELFGGSA